MSPARRTDVAIIGDGVIGLSTALELARAGATCCLIAAERDGAASAAAAGLLAAALGRLPPDVRPFFKGSLDRYESFLEPLREYDPGLSTIRGLVEVHGQAIRQPEEPSSRPLTGDEVARLEPSLSAPLGGLLHPRDGAVDNVRLVRALRRAVANQANIRLVSDSPADIVATTEAAASVALADGTRIEAGHVVIAAGAWSPSIRGLPRPLPVSPRKGQMLAFGATSLRHPVMGPDVYLVPREHEVAVGATIEDTGFDTTTTSAAIDGLAAAARSLCPALAAAPIVRTWAGIRPATPDMLPIIGRDPDTSRLLYACGHSKNGILLAPATARAIVALAQGTRPEWDLTPFSITRFGPAERGLDH